MERVSCIFIVVALGLAAASAQILDCKDNPFPKELMGVWRGADAFLFEECGWEGNACREEKLEDISTNCKAEMFVRDCVGYWLESCEGDIHRISEAGIDVLHSFECTGSGEGTTVARGVFSEQYYCGTFKVEGSKVRTLYGWPVESADEAVCPPADAKLGEHPSVWGVMEVEMADTNDLVDKKDWTCQETPTGSIL